MKFLVKFAFYGVAYVAGTVSPAVGSAIKKFLAKEEAAVKAEVAKLDAKVDAGLKKL